MDFTTEHNPRYTALLDAANAPTKVGSYTHTFYRYPARFGESFVREAIENFSERSDVIFDPFCGGGTTLVEALASGRTAIGTDISELAIAIARAKTTLLSEAQLTTVGTWVEQTTRSTRALLCAHPESRDPKLVNVPPGARNLIATLRERVKLLPRGACQTFATCVVLKTVQWAYDGKEAVPTPTQIVARIRTSFDEMRSGMDDFVKAIRAAGIPPSDARARVILRVSDAESLSTWWTRGRFKQPSLVVTSPPYLGVHVLYNRWQLQGRKELQAPFFIADCRDIGGASAYTLVSRASGSQHVYFQRIHRAFAAVADVIKPRAFLIQLVSFANAEASLPPYLQALASAGLQPCETYMRIHGDPSWREVPGRRWYARVGAVRDSSAAKEVLLIHRKGA
jgi:DNA methylase